MPFDVARPMLLQRAFPSTRIPPPRLPPFCTEGRPRRKMPWLHKHVLQGSQEGRRRIERAGQRDAYLHVNYGCVCLGSWPQQQQLLLKCDARPMDLICQSERAAAATGVVNTHRHRRHTSAGTFIWEARQPDAVLPFSDPSISRHLSVQRERLTQPRQATSEANESTLIEGGKDSRGRWQSSRNRETQVHKPPLTLSQLDRWSRVHVINIRKNAQPMQACEGLVVWILYARMEVINPGHLPISWTSYVLLERTDTKSW